MNNYQVFQAPLVRDDDWRVISMIEEMRRVLSDRTAEPRRWAGGLRRMSLARVVQASNEIEGYNASLDDVVAVGDGERAVNADHDTWMALGGYRDAMTYVLQAAQDRDLVIDEGLVKALHFMMLKHDLDIFPGRWRPGAIFVSRQPTGETVYEGPPAECVPGLMAEMLPMLSDPAVPTLVRGAMAHLNLVLIHPFKDGNGRMARCLQSLVLARDQILAPAFSSIEEYLRHNTPTYYDVLGAVGQGVWTPGNDARPWVRFCLTAHYRQALTLQFRVDESERLWLACEEVANERSLPERSIGALWDASRGLRMRRASYRSVVKVTSGESISDLTASRDLKAMVDAGLLEPLGERRGRSYLATEPLLGVWRGIRAKRPMVALADPFEVDDSNQMELVSRE